jgi:cytochrome c biogenesis protein ResB
MKSLALRAYGALASLKLTIVVLAVLAVALIAGTFYESANGTPMVQKTFYSSRWFDAILIALTVNMVACTAKRYPYKPHQLGFLMVHCGILSILTGAMLTRNFGRTGELYLTEGETRDYMLSARPVLNVSVPQDGIAHQDVPIVFPAKAEGASVDRTLRLPHSPIRLHVTKYFPNARLETDVAEGQAENPAAQVRVTNSERTEESWLLPREAGHESFDAGAVRVEAVDAKSAEEAAAAVAKLEAQRPSGKGELQLQSGGHELAKIPLDGPMPRTVKSGEFEVRLRGWFSNFAFKDNVPVNASAAMANPAVLFDVTGSRGTENHIAFAFRDLKTLLSPDSDHGYGIQAKYAYDATPKGTPLVQLVHEPGGTWRLASNVDLDPPPAGGVLQPGSSYQAATAGFQIEVTRLFERGTVQQHVANTDRQENNPGLELQVTDGSQSAERTWMFFGDQRTFQVGGREVQVEIGRKQMPLGFSVHLIDFRETKYPGTMSSASFESDVVVSDAQGEPVPINISMNRPLKHHGFRLFQSSYARNGGTEASIFSVSYDPGVSVVYTGFIIFIVGLVVIFYLKPVIRKAYAFDRPAVGAAPRKDPS